MAKIQTNIKLPYRYFNTKEQRTNIYDAVKKVLSITNDYVIRFYEGDGNFYLTLRGWKERLIVVKLDGSYFCYTDEQKEKIKKAIEDAEEAKKIREQKERERADTYNKYKSIVTTDATRFFLGDTQYNVRLEPSTRTLTISIHGGSWEDSKHAMYIALDKFNEPSRGVLPMVFNFQRTSIESVIEYANKMREVEAKFTKFFNEVMVPKILAIEGASYVETNEDAYNENFSN